MRQTTKPQNHKVIITVASLVISRLLDTITFLKYFRCSRLSEFDINRGEVSLLTTNRETYQLYIPGDLYFLSEDHLMGTLLDSIS